MLQKQLVTYDGKRDIKAYNQFFQQLDQLFSCQHVDDKDKILIAAAHLRDTAN
ncbi:hypothetical protein HK104_007102, partial [Borealophlyctis nickersoniae]